MTYQQPGNNPQEFGSYRGESTGQTNRGIGSQSGESSRSVGQRAGESMHNVGESARQIRDRASERMHRAGDYVRDKSKNMGRQVQHGMSQGKDWFANALDEYPLAMGASFMVLGMAAGFLIPTSKPERRMIGRAGKRVMSQAQEMGSRIIDKGEEAAERAVEAMKSSVKREQRG